MRPDTVELSYKDLVYLYKNPEYLKQLLRTTHRAIYSDDETYKVGAFSALFKENELAMDEGREEGLQT